MNAPVNNDVLLSQRVIRPGIRLSEERRDRGRQNMKFMLWLAARSNGSIEHTFGNDAVESQAPARSEQ